MFRFNRKSLVGISLVVLLGLSSMVLGQKGAAAPAEFSLRSIDRQVVTSDSLRGEVVVLAFGASWLQLSRAQLQGVKKLADTYTGRGVVVFWVSTESEDAKSKNYASDEQLRAFGKRYGLDVTILRDPDMMAAKKLGADELPSIIILNKQGVAVGEPIKGIDPDGNLAGQVAEKLDRIL